MLFLRKFFASVALVVAVSAAVGCGRMPTAPNAVEQTAIHDNGRTAEPDGLIGSVLDLVVGLLVKVVNIVGSLGGSVTNGRWRIDVPPNAIEGNAAVSVAVVDASSPNVDLDILPASKNHFSVPVRVSAMCSNVPTAELRTYVIKWYNPATRKWVDVPGSTVDLSTKTVSAPLQHFSKYCVGPAQTKAGW